MSDRTSIVIPREDFERHNARRNELGLTWVEYLDGEAPDFGTLDEDDVRRIVREELREAFADLRR